MRCSVPSALFVNALRHSSNDPIEGIAVIVVYIRPDQLAHYHNINHSFWFDFGPISQLDFKEGSSLPQVLLLLISHVLCRKSSEIILLSITILLCFMMDMFSPEHIHHNFTSVSHKVMIEKRVFVYVTLIYERNFFCFPRSLLG
jgi:hypothetical protein